MMDSGIFNPGAAAMLDQEDTTRVTMLHIKSLLWLYYKETRKVDKEMRTKGSEVRVATQMKA